MKNALAALLFRKFRSVCEAKPVDALAPLVQDKFIGASTRATKLVNSGAEASSASGPKHLPRPKSTEVVQSQIFMANLLVLYNTPADPAAFDSYYQQTHIPLAQKIPGLRSYTVNNGPVQAIAGSAPYLVATLTFDSMADINAALVSPEGQAAAADLPNFASAGATLLIFDSKKV